MNRTRAALGVAIVLVAAWCLYSLVPKRAGSGAVGEGQSSTGASAPDPALSAGAAPRTAVEGGVTVVGRIVDQDGQPFADLDVAASGGELPRQVARTGADGAFELPRLPRTALELDLSADFDPAQPLGQRTLAAAVPALPLDVRQGPARVDVGTHVLPRSHPFWIEGWVELDADWAGKKGVTRADVRIELETPNPEDHGVAVEPERKQAPGAPPDWRDPPWRAVLPEAPAGLQDDGTFRFAVETPHDPFVLRLRIRRYEPLERVIFPEPDATHTEMFQLP